MSITSYFDDVGQAIDMEYLLRLATIMSFWDWQFPEESGN